MRHLIEHAWASARVAHVALLFFFACDAESGRGVGLKALGRDQVSARLTLSVDVLSEASERGLDLVHVELLAVAQAQLGRGALLLRGLIKRVPACRLRLF